MRIDCYGSRADGGARLRRPEREPFGVKKAGGATYMRFAARSPAPIHRLSVDEGGTVRHEWAYGMWADAKSLAYVPVDETLEVPE